MMEQRAMTLATPPVSRRERSVFTAFVLLVLGVQMVMASSSRAEGASRVEGAWTSMASRRSSAWNLCEDAASEAET
jgi:hypothetical protein